MYDTALVVLLLFFQVKMKEFMHMCYALMHPMQPNCEKYIKLIERMKLTYGLKFYYSMVITGNCICSIHNLQRLTKNLIVY